MIRKKSWIDLGYELFSAGGHLGLQVERLSRILGRNKSGFYHYFGEMDFFLYARMEEYSEQIKLIKDFHPQCIQLRV